MFVCGGAGEKSYALFKEKMLRKLVLKKAVPNCTPIKMRQIQELCYMLSSAANNGANTKVQIQMYWSCLFITVLPFMQVKYFLQQAKWGNMAY